MEEVNHQLISEQLLAENEHLREELARIKLASFAIKWVAIERFILSAEFVIGFACGLMVAALLEG